MNGSWLKLYRSIVDTSFWHDDWLVRLWIWCLVKANYTDGTWRGMPVKRGEFVTGRNRAAEELGVSPSKWMRGIAKLVEAGCIKYDADKHWTRISVCNYSTYQDDDREKRTSGDTTRDTTSGQTVTQQADTIEERKKLRTTGTGSATDFESTKTQKPVRRFAATDCRVPIGNKDAIAAVRCKVFDRAKDRTLQGIPDEFGNVDIAEWWLGHIGGDPLTGDTVLDLLLVLCSAAKVRKGGYEIRNKPAKLASMLISGEWLSCGTDLVACHKWIQTHMADWVITPTEAVA